MAHDLTEPITATTKLVLGDWVCGQLSSIEEYNCYRLGVWFPETRDWGLFKDGINHFRSGIPVGRVSQESLVLKGFEKNKDRLAWRFPNETVYIGLKKDGKIDLMESVPGKDPTVRG